jgi:hypothetical protein
MDALSTKWRENNRYPIIVMDTKPWAHADMSAIRRKWTTLDFKFINVEYAFNHVPDIPEHAFEDAKSPQSDMNYKRMCHFFFKGFTQVPVLMQYRYLLRLDDDTCLLDHINYDIFQVLAERRAAYAYSHIWYDAEAVTKGLYTFVDQYVRNHSIPIKNPALYNATTGASDFPNTVPCFNTNFEVINTVRYRDPAVRSFVDAVVASNMIFHRRWGDAPLRVPLAMLFWEDSELVRLESADVQHSAWDALPMTETTAHGNPPELVPEPPLLQRQ